MSKSELNCKITKEEFCSLIELIENYEQYISRIENVAGIALNDEMVTAQSTAIIDHLNIALGLTANKEYGSIIDYFCWELNFGKDWEPSRLTHWTGEPIKLATVEDLWDVICDGFLSND